MGLRYVRTWLFLGALALGACSDSHDAQDGDEPNEEDTDPAATDDEDGQSELDARVSSNASDAGSARPPEAIPNPGSSDAGANAGPGDNGKRDRPMGEAGMPMPKPMPPERDGGPMPRMPKPPEAKHDAGPPPPMPKPDDAKRDGGPAPKPDAGS